LLVKCFFLPAFSVFFFGYNFVHSYDYLSVLETDTVLHKVILICQICGMESASSALPPRLFVDRSCPHVCVCACACADAASYPHAP
jgi:hypothetical protein